MKTCVFCCNPFMVLLKELSCFFMRSDILSRKSRSDSCEGFLPLSTGIILVNFLLRLFASISFICSLVTTCGLSSSVTLWLLIDDSSQGSTNCVHGDGYARNVYAKSFSRTKLGARKSIKTPLSSIPMLFHVASCFCVWKQIIFGTIRSDTHNIFHLRNFC